MFSLHSSRNLCFSSGIFLCLCFVDSRLIYRSLEFTASTLLFFDMTAENQGQDLHKWLRADQTARMTLHSLTFKQCTGNWSCFPLILLVYAIRINIFNTYVYIRIRFTLYTYERACRLEKCPFIANRRFHIFYLSLSQKCSWST